MKKIIAWVTKTFSNPWYIASVVAAFIGMISYFNINSYKADKNGLNGFWLVMGIVFTLVSIGLIIKAYKSSAGKGG